MKTLKHLSFVIFAAFAFTACGDKAVEPGGEDKEVNLKIVFDQPATFYLGQSKEVAYTLPEDQPASITAVEVPEGWKVDIATGANTIVIRCGHSAVNGDAQIELSDEEGNSSKTPLTLTNNNKNYYVLKLAAHKGIPIYRISPEGLWVQASYSNFGSFTHKVGTSHYDDYNEIIYGVSDDGTPHLSPNEDSDTYAGYRSVKIELSGGGSNTFNIPIVVLDGVPQDLPQPDVDYAGRGVDQLYSGHVATNISEDRKIIVGYMIDMLSARLAVMWRFNEQTQEYEYKFIREDLLKVVDARVDEYLELTGSMSPDGRYAACSFVEKELSYAALYDSETDEVVIVKEQPDAYGQLVSGDGKLFLGSPRRERQRLSFVYDGGTVQTLKYWIKNTYGIDMPSNFGTPMTHTKDWNSFVWFEYSEDYGGFGNHIITNRDVLEKNGVTTGS